MNRNNGPANMSTQGFAWVEFKRGELTTDNATLNLWHRPSLFASSSPSASTTYSSAMRDALNPLFVGSFAISLCCGLFGCTAPQARSCLGAPLDRPTMAPEKRARLEADLRAAEIAAQQAPESEDAAIWVGRRLSYLGRYQDAIACYTEAIAQFGATAKLLRHRGHRYITVREFDRAREDLANAWLLAAAQLDAVEPDGIPTAAGPRSTLKGNIAYHRALAEFCLGDFESARIHWRDAIDVATNDDSRVAALYWLAVTECERGSATDALAALDLITPSMDVQENQTYLQLALLLKGTRDANALLATDSALGIGVDRATLGFGKAMHARYILKDERQSQRFLEETAGLAEWAAFGVIASDAMLAREAAHESTR